MRRLLVVLLLVVGSSAYSLNISDLGAGERIGALATYGADSGATWDWDSAWEQSKVFAPVGRPLRSFGYSGQPFWFRIDWTRQPGDSRSFFLASWLVHLDVLEVRFRDDSGWLGEAHRLGVNQINEQPRLAPVSVELPPGDHGSILIKISSVTNVLFDSRIYDLQHLTWVRVGAAIFVGGVLGFLFLMFVVALFAGFRLEDVLFLWYSAYVLAMAAFLLEYSGLLQALFPDALGLEDAVNQPINGLLFLLTAVFAYKANVAPGKPWAWPAFLVVGAGILFGLMVHFSGGRSFAIQWSNGVLLVLSVIIEIGAVFQVLRKRRFFSRYFAAGWSVLLFSSSWMALAATGIPGPWEDIVWDSFSMFTGVIVENIIVAAAMADRVSRVYQELDDQRARAERAGRLATIGVMTAQVGHEINTPNHVIVLKAALLDSIRTRAETLIEDPEAQLGQELREMGRQIQGIREASSQIHRVIQDLGGTARRNAPPVRIDLGNLVRKLVMLYGSTWREKTRKLTIQAPPAGTVIWGVEYRLHQLVVNLVNNGLQALPNLDRGLSILVNPAPGEVQLTVTDHGRGMSSDVLERLGKLFFTTRQDDGGTGLGWRLCQEIAKEHTARIEIASIPDRGTTVMVRFPVYE